MVLDKMVKAHAVLILCSRGQLFPLMTERAIDSALCVKEEIWMFSHAHLMTLFYRPPEAELTRAATQITYAV